MIHYLKDFLFYGVGRFAPRLVFILIIPILTRLFSPEDIGVIDFFRVFSVYLGILMGLGLDHAHAYYFTNNTVTSTKLMGTRILWGTVLGSLLSIIIYLAHPHYLSNMAHPIALVAIIWASFFAMLIYVGLETLRLIEKPGQFFVLSIIQIGLVIVCLYIFLTRMESPVLAYSWAYFLAGLIGVVFMMFMLGNWGRPKLPSQSELRRWVSFSLPLLPAQIYPWILINIAQYFILRLSGPRELGIFAIPAVLALMVSSFGEIIRLAIWPRLLNRLKNKAFLAIFKLEQIYLLLCVIFGIVVSGLAKHLVLIFGGATYLSSWPYVSSLCLGSLLFTGNYLFGLGALEEEKTRKVFFVYAASFALYFCATPFMISFAGIKGAIFSYLGCAILTNLGLLTIRLGDLSVKKRVLQYISIILFTGTCMVGLIYVLKGIL